MFLKSTLLNQNTLVCNNDHFLLNYAEFSTYFECVEVCKIMDFSKLDLEFDPKIPLTTIPKKTKTDSKNGRNVYAAKETRFVLYPKISVQKTTVLNNSALQRQQMGFHRIDGKGAERLNPYFYFDHCEITNVSQLINLSRFQRKSLYLNGSNLTVWCKKDNENKSQKPFRAVCSNKSWIYFNVLKLTEINPGVEFRKFL